MTAHASLSSSGGMLGKMGSGAVTASASLSGSGSVASDFSFFYPSTNGPTNANSYGSTATWAFMFQVTASGHSLAGYAFWVCPGSPAGETAAQTFALWHWNGSAWVYDSAATVTSGTLSTGWNKISLGSAYSLTASTNYMAQTAVNGNFTNLGNQFGTGDPYAGGFTNGPLNVYSDRSGTDVPPSSNGQCPFSTTITDPTASAVSSLGSNSSWWGLDVIVQ